MDTTNFSHNYSSNYLNSSNKLSYSTNFYTPESESSTSLSASHPFKNDPLITSLLEKYKLPSANSVNNSGMKQLDNSQSTQANSCYSPQNFKYISSYQSPPQHNQVKFSDIMSDKSPNISYNYQVESMNSNYTLQRENDRQKEQIDLLNREILSLRASNTALTQQNEQLNQNLRQYEIQHHQNKQSIDKYEKSILILDQRVSELESQISLKNQELNNIQKKSLDQELSKLSGVFHQEKAQLLQENSNLKLELEVLRSKIPPQHSNAQGNLQNQSKDSSLLQQFDELQLKCTEMEKVCIEFQQMQEENKILKDELIKRIEQQEQSMEGANLSQIVQQKDQEIDQLQKSILIIHSQLETELANKNNLNQQEAEEFQDSLKEKIIEQQEIIMEKEEEIENLASSVAALDEKCKNQEEALIQRQKELEELVESHNNMKEENLVLRISVSCKEKEYNDMVSSMVKQQQDQQCRPKRNTNMTNSLDLAK